MAELCLDFIDLTNKMLPPPWKPYSAKLQSFSGICSPKKDNQGDICYFNMPSEGCAISLILVNTVSFISFHFQWFEELLRYYRNGCLLPPSPPASSVLSWVGEEQAVVNHVSVQCKVCEGMQSILYKKQGHIVRSTTQQKKVDLEEIDLTWPLHFLSASALE